MSGASKSSSSPSTHKTIPKTASKSTSSATPKALSMPRPEVSRRHVGRSLAYSAPTMCLSVKDFFVLWRAQRMTPVWWGPSLDATIMTLKIPYWTVTLPSSGPTTQSAGGSGRRTEKATWPVIKTPVSIALRKLSPPSETTVASTKPQPSSSSAKTPRRTMSSMLAKTCGDWASTTGQWWRQTGLHINRGSRSGSGSGKGGGT